MREFVEYLKQNKDKVWRFFIYKRMFTPYEQEQKFMDETEFVDTCYEVGTVENAWVLPDGDILIEFRTHRYITDLYKLSEIRLCTKED